MSAVSFLREHRTATAVAVVASLVAGTVVALALKADGYESRHVDLNDGGIFVTSNFDGLFGRLNKPAGSLDLALNPPGGAQGAYRLDVRQSGAAVAAWDQGAGKLLPVDVASGKADNEQAVPVSADEDVEIAGGTVAVLDPAVGKVWATRVDESTSITSLTGVDPSAKAAIAFPKRDVATARAASLAVDRDGTLYAASSAGDVAVAAKQGAKYAKPTFSRVAGKLESVQVTVVGSQVVVLDAKDGTVYLPGGRKVTVPADAEARLQAPTDGGDEVVLASRTKLISVPLSGGKPVTLYSGANGRPAAPTWLGDCLHAAWGGEAGVYARACGGEKAKRIGLPGAKPLAEPVFRVNRGAILLNDLSLGNVYDVDTLQEVDNWSAVKPPPLVKPSKDDKNNRNSVAARDQPPKAVDDSWGARPGRTTVLHVLDNDSDPQGSILSIARLGPVSDPTASIATAPDGQAVNVTLPSSGARDVSFKYTIDNGKGLTASATVNVQLRNPAQNESPRKRNGFVQQTFTTSAGGSLDLPVLDEWRDFDGDPLVITQAKVEGQGGGAGAVTIAPSGRLNFVASAQGGAAGINYTVSDGASAPAAQRIPLTILKATSNETAAPVAQPDIARGQVGKPITLKPLANDLPGADPTNPNAELAIAGTIAQPAGAHVDTDLKSGTVTITATRPGTFALTYTASYGNAKFDQAPVRIDAAAAPPSAQPPVAVPDTGVLYGQTATTTDVLANDFDPAGGVLVVQRAQAADPDQLQVSVIAGRFLRVGARQPDLAQNPQVVRYTITNGLTAPVTGELTVTQVPPPQNDTPLAIDDYATVRGGDSTLVPVLDNDIDPAGASLALLDDVPGAPASGSLTVTGGDGATGDLGAAYVSDKQVRYAAPVVTAPKTVTITYVARNPGGSRATGTVHVTVTPPPSAQNPNQAPAAEPINSRVVSGQTLRIKIPTTGVDPDGDTANVTAIASAPTLGRVVTIGATSITYEAFPTTSGTDRFSYVISDKFGKKSTSTIAVGVAQVSDPQPPTAVDDTITASPNAKVRVDVLANDVIAPDDSVAIGNLGAINPDLPTTVKRVAAGGPVQVGAPAGDGQSVNVLYSITDGAGDPSIATITVRSQTGYVPPPAVNDIPAILKPGATTATVDVLKGASDPQSLPLKVAKVFDAKATVRAGTGMVTVPVTAQVQNIVYSVANTQGGTAAAVIHVPARGTGAPYVKPDQLISIGVDESKTIDIADYVVDPAGKPLRLTTADKLSAAPGTGLKLTSPDPSRLTVTGTDGYNGPGAISFEITDGTSLNDPAGQLALVTIQVQVGPNTPVIRCPSAPITVVEGGPDRRLDIASLCHVWLADRSQLDDLDFTASWTKQPSDVSILGNKSSVIGLRAGNSATPGQTGTLKIGADGSRAQPSTLNVTIGKLGRASMSPIRIDGFKAGATATRDIRGSVTSPLRSPDVSVVRITQASGEPARATANGSVVSIVPGAKSSGVMTFDVLATDVPDKSRTERQFRGRITLEVLNVPDAPGQPQVGRAVLSQTVVLAWPTPAANGAQIDRYQVQYSGGSQTCAASPCRITGLTNGRAYTFRVLAHNAVGNSTPSPASPSATPDKLPAAVANLRTSNPQDGQLTVSWTPVSNGGTAPKNYRVSWSGGGFAPAAGTARSVVARGLNNNNVYSFTVVAVNNLGAGPPAGTRGQSAGAPATPSGVNVSYADAAGTATRTTRVNWTASNPNGPTPATYTVTRDGQPICRDTQATSCTDTPATGKTYTYRVVATNGAGKVSAAGTKAFVVTGTPETPSNVSATHTAKDGELTVAYTAPNSRGQTSRIVCTTDQGSCGTWNAPAPGSRDSQVITGLDFDRDVPVYLQSCNEERCGSNSPAAIGHTSGLPRPPEGMSCSTSGRTITWTWNRPEEVNGYTVHFKLSGAHRDDNFTQTRYAETFEADGGSSTLTVTSVDSRGEEGASRDAKCDHAPKPDPQTFRVRMGDHTTAGDCTTGCSFLAISFSGLPAGQTWHVYFNADDGYARDYSFSTGNGSGNPQFPGYWGAPDSAGNGTVTGRITNANGTTVTDGDKCSGDWQNTKGCA